MNPEKTLPATFLGVIALISYREVKSTGTLPGPHKFLSGATVYTMLFLLGAFAPELASVMSLGLLVAIAMVPGVLDPAQWKSVGFTLPGGASIGTLGPNGVGQPGTKGLQTPGAVGGLTVPPGSTFGGGTVPKVANNGPGAGALQVP